MNVGLVFGGKSVEHEISIRSARNVFDNIPSEYKTVVLGISKAGTWHLMQEPTADISGPEVLVKLNSGQGMLWIPSLKKEIAIDIFFPVLHGTDGEDGSIQGMFSCLDVPFVGSGTKGSAVAMDKLLTKRILASNGLPVAKFISVDNFGSRPDFNQVVAQIGKEIIIKPANLGSSVGVSKAQDVKTYEAGLKEVFKYDKQAIVEEFVNARELECGILGNEASDPGEVIISDAYEFYTYEAKYEDENAVKIQVPASLDRSVMERIKAACLKSFQVLGCEDFGRVDLFYVESEDRILINEINSIPGFTSASMFPLLWANHGISYKELIGRLLKLGIDKAKMQKETTIK